MLWNFTAESAFYEASPTLSAGGMLYIGNNDQHMYALNAATGALVWKYRTQWSYIRSTPVLSLDGSSLFFGSGNGYLYKLLAATGGLQVFYSVSHAYAPARTGPLVLLRSGRGSWAAAACRAPRRYLLMGQRSTSARMATA